jgi:hypothetical protein
VSIATAGKKIKPDEEAMNEILVADTNSESDSEAGDFADYFAAAAAATTTTTSLSRNQNTGCSLADYLHGDCLKEGTQIFIHLSVQQKV